MARPLWDALLDDKKNHRSGRGLGYRVSRSFPVAKRTTPLRRKSAQGGRMSGLTTAVPEISDLMSQT